MLIELRGGLVDVQAEEGGEGDDVRYNLGLQVLVGYPVDIGGEEIELNGQAPLRGLQLAHHGQHCVVDPGVFVDISIHAADI